VDKNVEERRPSSDVFGDGIDDSADYSAIDEESFDAPPKNPDDRIGDESEKRRAERRPRGERSRGDKSKRQLSEEDDRRGGDEDREAVAAVTKSGKIPSWAEALEGIVASNTENHTRNPGGGGRGRGRGPR
jgi:hypothetical protein